LVMTGQSCLSVVARALLCNFFGCAGSSSSLSFGEAVDGC
jgi:hypothetical protein